MEFKDVYTIQEVGEKNYWIRLGVAFVNKDGSLNVRLDGLPVNGKLHIREHRTQQNTENNPQEG